MLNFIKYILVLSFLLLPFGAISQEELSNLNNKPYSSDTIMLPPKRPWLAAGEAAASNLALWAFCRFALEGDYAYISINTMKRNLQKGFHWDNDKFSTNLFSHPYHGSFYYSAARSNGMNFWKSGIYAFGGSLMWELFMENELPATNDLFSTSIGGMAMGESLYRVSDLILDNRTWGWNRLVRECLGFTLSPGRGLTRVLTGESWKRSGNSGRQFSIPEIEFELSGGTRALEIWNLQEDTFDDDVIGFCLNAQVNYGDLFDDENSTSYSYFFFYSNFNIQRNQPIIGQLNLMGRLWGNPLYETDNNQIALGAFQHFDYYNSDTIANAIKVPGTKTPYKIGSPASGGLGLVCSGNIFNKMFSYNMQAHANAILIGCSLSDYSAGEDRNYNWGSGYSAKVKLNLSFKDKISIDFNNSVYHIFTWNGYSPDNTNLNKVFYAAGDKSNAIYFVMDTKFGYKFNEKWSIYWQRSDYFRKTRYAYYPNFYSTTSDTRFLLAYRF